MVAFLKILIKWLPAILSALREIFKIIRESRLHRIEMQKLKKILTDAKTKATEKTPQKVPDPESLHIFSAVTKRYHVQLSE